MKHRRFDWASRSPSMFSPGTMLCLASAVVVHESLWQAAVASGINYLETAQG